MHEETTPNPPSIAEILSALIPALVLFLDSILANPNQPQTPALRRLARTVAGFRALAALFGIHIATTPKPAVRSRSTSRAAARPAPIDPPHTPAALRIRRPSLSPQPWCTLEL